MIGLPQIEEALAHARARVLAGPPETAMALALCDLGIDPGAAARVALAYAIEADVPEERLNGEASAFLMGLATARELVAAAPFEAAIRANRASVTPTHLPLEEIIRAAR